MEKHITITDAQVTDILKRLHSQGHMLEHYIAMQGIHVPNLDGDGLRKATEIAEKPPEFKDVAVRNTADTVISLADLHLKFSLKPLNREAFFGEVALGDVELAESIENLSLAVHKIGFSELIRRMNYDIVSYLTVEIPKIRDKEISDMKSALEAKRNYLLPYILAARASSKNKYGDFDFGPVDKEVHEFICTHFAKGSLSFFSRAHPINILRSYVLEWLPNACQPSELPMDGLMFEHWCAEQLELTGWSCAVSRASGDQGVDVFATKHGRVVAIQCKRFTAPIGNKAVQEAHAGMKHYNANFAVVLGTGGFTKSAQELAATTGVQLVDAANISLLETLVFQQQ